MIDPRGNFSSSRSNFFQSEDRGYEKIGPKCPVCWLEECTMDFMDWMRHVFRPNSVALVNISTYIYLYLLYMCQKKKQIWEMPQPPFRTICASRRQRQTDRHLKYCARLQMNNFLIKLFPVLIMFCTLCCHRYLQHPNITILDVGRTHIHFLDMTVICVTVILWLGCCIKTVINSQFFISSF